MRLLLCIWITIIITNAALAQEECPEYETLIKEAKEYFKQSDYRNTLYKYNSAKTCSPTRRTEVDSMINVLFEKIDKERIKAKAGEKKINIIYKQMLEATNRAKYAEIQKNDADSSRIADKFKNKNEDWFKKMTVKEQNEMLGYIVQLNSMNRIAEVDSLATCFRLLNDAKTYEKAYSFCNDNNSTFIKEPEFWRNKTTAVTYYKITDIDLFYYWGLGKINQATDLLPIYSKRKYGSLLFSAYSSLNAKRKMTVQDYWMPDTLIQLPELPDKLFGMPCADNKNFVWGYTDYNDYKKLQVRFINLSLTDFSFTTDSLVTLSDTGRFYSILASAGNYQYKLGQGINYSLKKNKVEYKKKEFDKPAIIKLMDGQDNTLADFSGNTTFFFSPDAHFLATWNIGLQLVLYNVTAQEFIPLPNVDSTPTMSFSSDSKTIAYYNKKTKLIYFADMEGHILDQIPSALTGITNIGNIDFTGNDGFLKINNDDSICLFNIREKRKIFNFNKAFVKEVVMAPNKKDILVTCNTQYKLSGETKKGYLTLLIDADLNIKAKLYSECENYFFTPGGKFIIGYRQSAIMRWPVNNLPVMGNKFQTSLSFDELVAKDCFPYNQFMAIEDASQIETGARHFKDIAEKQTDLVLKGLYYLQSRALFDRLAYGNAKNIRKERIPFYYDWYNWIDAKLAYKNFRDRFIRQQTAVKIFDDLVNSPDSIYPQQLYYAANGNMLLGNLYDSLGAYNNDYIDQVKKELSLRERVFIKDPDNKDNIYYFTNAFKKLSAICDSTGWMNITNREYPDRLLLFRSQKFYLAEKMKILPDSFGLKTQYVNALTQLSASFLYVYANRPGEYINALDSAIYYADNGLALSTNKFDSARLLIVKARAYLIGENGLEKAMNLYRLVKTQFSELNRQSMLRQLQYLKDAGAKNTANIRSIEEFLKQ